MEVLWIFGAFVWWLVGFFMSLTSYYAQGEITLADVLTSLVTGILGPCIILFYANEIVIWKAKDN